MEIVGYDNKDKFTHHVKEATLTCSIEELKEVSANTMHQNQCVAHNKLMTTIIIRDVVLILLLLTITAIMILNFFTYINFDRD